VGTIALPATGPAYLDTQVLIYSVEAHPTYAQCLAAVWAAIGSGSVVAVGSQLSVLEVLVLPLRAGNTALVARYDHFLRAAGVRLAPVTEPILRVAARLRATVPRLKTPDSIHAATAIAHGATLFLTNDIGFKNVPGLTVELLDDVLARP
jgi:predicted nucleic acid-binding protein